MSLLAALGLQELEAKWPARIVPPGAPVGRLAFAAAELLDGGTAAKEWDTITLGSDTKSARKGEVSWKLDAPQTVYGFAYWWEAELIEGITLSTAPDAPATHWEQLYFPLQTPISLEAGESVLVTLRSRSSEEAGTHLDRSAYVLLARLADEHCRVGELAEHLCLDVSTVSRQVHALEQRGLVRREPHPIDRRGSVVVIAPEGREALEQHRQARRKVFADLLDDVSADELEAVTAMLDRLAARIEAMAGA